ncbi:MAG TPA: response regulator [Chloroflexota bacterium]
MPRHPRILVVDDEPLIRELVADALSETGFDVHSAASGVQALDLLRRWLPQAIVLDLMMPQMDGFGEALRRDPRLASIPVLLVTAAHAPHDAAQRMRARAVLPKPFEIDDLLDLVIELAGEPSPRGRPHDLYAGEAR